MSTATFQSGPESTEPGVTTRSRKRLRDGAVPSSPAPDSVDRKKSKPEPASAALRRSSRHAAIVASRTKRDNSPTRQDPADFETPSTSRSTSLVDEESDSASVSPSPLPVPRERGYAPSQNDLNGDPSGPSKALSAPILPGLPSPWKARAGVVEIIDLTDAGHKRKRTTLISDDVDFNDFVAGESLEVTTHEETLQRVTRSTAKRARLEKATHSGTTARNSSRRARPTRPTRRSARTGAHPTSTVDVTSVLHIETLDLSETEASNEGPSRGEPDASKEDQSEPSVPEILDPLRSSDAVCTTASGDPPVQRHPDLPSVLESGCDSPDNGQLSHLVPPIVGSDEPQPPSSAFEPVPERDSGGKESPVDSATIEIGMSSSVRDDLSLNSGPHTVHEEDDGFALEVDTAISLSLPSEASAPSKLAEESNDDRARHFVAQSETGASSPTSDEGEPYSQMDHDMVVPATSTSSTPDPFSESTSDPSSGSSDPPRPPKSPSFVYFGVDVRFLRFRNPPTSYLAPNPVRRAPKHPTVRRDQFRYLPDATEKAGLLAFAQTRRQFPRWMKRPSRNYFVGTKFIPRGEPADERHMDTEEIGVGMDIDNALASSAARDIFLLPQNELYPSESSYTTPQMELDPDLDPSSLLDRQSMFYTQGGTTDFLGAGPSSASYASTPYQQREQSPQGRIWTPHGMSPQLQDGFTPGQGSLAGPSNAPVAAFHTNSGSGSLPGSAQSYAQELPWDPANWANSPQFALFGVPPLPLPAQNMSMDSSLSAMATYFVNDTHKAADSNVVDGIPPPHPQSQFGLPQQLHSNTPDAYQQPPL